MSFALATPTVVDVGLAAVEGIVVGADEVLNTKGFDGAATAAAVADDAGNCINGFVAAVPIVNGFGRTAAAASASTANPALAAAGVGTAAAGGAVEKTNTLDAAGADAVPKVNGAAAVAAAAAGRVGVAKLNGEFATANVSSVTGVSVNEVLSLAAFFGGVL